MSWNIAIYIFLCIVFFLVIYKNKDFINKAEVLLNERENLIILISLIGISIFYIVNIRSGQNWGGDFSQYIAQAKALVDGNVKECVADLTYISQNSFAGLAPEVYPWGFSLLLAPVYLLFGENYFAFKIVGVISYEIALLLMYKMCSLRFKKITSLIVMLQFAFSAEFIITINSVLSDLPFMCVSIGAIYAYNKILLNDKKKINYGIACGLCTFFVYILRTNGIVTLLTIICMDCFLVLYFKVPFIKKRICKFRYEKQSFMPRVWLYGIFTVGVSVVDIALPSAGGGYGLINKISMLTIVTNFIRYFMCIGQILVGDNKLFWLYYAIIIAMIIIGIKERFWNELSMIIYVMGSFALLIIYPGSQGVRYAYSILLFLVILSLHGLKNVAENAVNSKKIKSKFVKILSVNFKSICASMIMAMIVVVSGTGVYKYIETYDVNMSNGSQSKCAYELYEFIEKNTSEDSVILSQKPRVIYLNTNRIGFHNNKPDKVVKADYVVMIEGNITPEYDSKIFENDNLEFKSIFKNEISEVYKIVKR